MRLRDLMPWNRHKGGLEQAREERRKSEQSLHESQQQVTGPLRDLAARNHYAQIIARQIRRNT